mmetsp:Transcript_29265/g.54000  ORF Transcript_29265/g.54000 Transcript_29265/m.54000 type:complete len:288 (-) Transcript_29265:157-1020(-)
MMCSPRLPSAFLLLLLLLAMTTKVALSKEGEKKKKENLGDVVFTFLDKNRDKEITIPEMNSQLLMLEKMANEGGEGDDDVKELRIIFKGLKKAAPHLFNLLDSDEDRRLDKQETKYITKFEESLNHNGNARIFVKECFEILDDDMDDRLSVDEILEGTKSKFLIGEIAASLHELLPLRDTPQELKKHIKRAMKNMWGDELDRESVTESVKWFDADGDGYIQWSEVTDVYNSFGKKFIGMASNIKSAGPMMGMFGGDKGQGEKKRKGPSVADAFKQKSNIHKDIRLDL